MDTLVLRSYRSLAEDLLLLYDVYMLTKNRRRGHSSISEYLDVVKAVIRAECTLIVIDICCTAISYTLLIFPSFPFPVATDGDNDLTGGTSHHEIVINRGDHSLPKLAYAYFRSVILQILVEEASLFPLWLFKAAVTTNDDLLRLWIKGEVITLFKFWYEFCKYGWTNGGLYEELYPYLCARVLSHGDYAFHLSRQFAQGYVAQFEHSPLTLLKKRKHFSANTLIMNRNLEKSTTSSLHGSSASVTSREGDDLQELSSHQAIDSKSPQASANSSGFLLPLILSPQEALSRCFRLSLAQPFYAMSLMMLQAHIKARQMDMNANVGRTLIRDSSKHLSQNATLSFQGLLAVCLVPIEFAYLGLGTIETLINRLTVKTPRGGDNRASVRLNDYGSSRLLPKLFLPLVDALSTGVHSLIIEAQELVTSHGFVGLGTYGAISCMQYVPGLVNFISARILLFLVSGPSSIRLRQLARRKEIVQKYCDGSIM